MFTEIGINFILNYLLSYMIYTNEADYHWDAKILYIESQLFNILF